MNKYNKTAIVLSSCIPQELVSMYRHKTPEFDRGLDGRHSNPCRVVPRQLCAETDRKQNKLF